MFKIVHVEIHVIILTFFITRRAVQLYTEALTLDPENHILLTNRAAAHLKLGQLEQSLGDAVKARTLCPKWGKVSL